MAPHSGYLSNTNWVSGLLKKRETGKGLLDLREVRRGAGVMNIIKKKRKKY